MLPRFCDIYSARRVQQFWDIIGATDPLGRGGGDYTIFLNIFLVDHRYTYLDINCKQSLDNKKNALKCYTP